jgi:hypothetical protein
MKKIILFFAAAFALAFAVSPLVERAHAAPFVSVSPSDASGTIASTGVYQTLFSLDPNRTGCLIQNQGVNPMKIRVGGATIWQLKAATSTTSGDGGSFNCNWEGMVVNSKIEITGTIGDAFAAAVE